MAYALSPIESSLALSDGLRRVAAATVSGGFDDAVLSALRRPPTSWELFASQIRVVAPAMACGAGAMLIFLQIALQPPDLTVKPTRAAVQTESIDMDKLMSLLDRPDLQVASGALLEQCVEQNPLPAPSPARVEKRLQRRASLATPAILI